MTRMIEEGISQSQEIVSRTCRAGREKFGAMPPAPWSVRVNKLLDERGWKVADLHKVTGIPEFQLRKQLAGGVLNPRGDTLARIAGALGVAESWLRYGVSNPDEHVLPAGRMGLLPIRYRVAAGLWAEVDDLQDAPIGISPMIPDERFAYDEQWAELVVGDSFDKEYPEGTIVHVRNAFGLDPLASNGKVVVVERRRAGGFLIERTLKQIAVTKGKVELWPRSNNPKWSAPVKLTDGVKKGEDVEVHISGLVIGAYLKRT
jgi:transcriptional regulator with XRE-family HTH domain